MQIPKGSFFVYYFLPRDEVMCDPQGEYLNSSNEAGVLFSTFEEAESYAKSFVKFNSKIGAGIWDNSYRVVARFLPEAVARRQDRANSPTRLFSWALVFLLSGGLLLWLEVRSGWTLIVCFLIGARLLVSGVLKSVAAIYTLKQGKPLR